jgi:hypothetical protein
MSRIPYAGHDAFEPEPEPIAPTPPEDTLRIHKLETDNRHLRETVRNLEGALRTCGRVLAPYIARTVNGATRREK